VKSLGGFGGEKGNVGHTGAPFLAVLQFCRSSLIRWADAPCIIGFRSVQVEAIRTGSHHSGGGLVSALFLVVPGCRGVARPSEASTPTTSRCGVGLERYAPEMERRLRLRLRPTNDSWRVDETYIRVKGKWVCLYRAVDSSGATIDFLLSAKRDESNGGALSRQGLGRREPSGAARNQHRRARRSFASHRAAQGRRRSGIKLPSSAEAACQTAGGKDASRCAVPDQTS
jgi:hypothetical protein